MDFSFKLPDSDRALLLILALIFMLTRLPPMVLMPFVQDEGLYAMMIEEQAAHPTLIPTLFGYPVSWKPAPFFWIYAAFSRLPLPLEIAYRLPSVLFGLAALFPLYYLLRNVGASRNLAFFSILMFLVSHISMYSQAALLTDSLLFLLICTALYVYTEKRFGERRFLVAGALAFFAFFVKLVIAAMIPVLALVYFLACDRKTMKRPLFLLSLLAVPFAFLLHFALLNSAGLGSELYSSDIGGHLLSPEGIGGQVRLLWGALHTLISDAGIWFALSIFGFWKYWRENQFMSVWYALTVFPVLTGFFMPWYYLPVLPAMCYFAALFLIRWEGKEKPDALFIIFVSLTAVATLFGSFIIYSNVYERFLPQKEAGLLLSDKEGVAIMGEYDPGIAAYKTTTELRRGKRLDFGWMTSANFTNQSYFEEFIRDYHSSRYPVVDGSFSSMFTSADIFRKDTNLTSFDYVVLVGDNAPGVPGAGLIYNNMEIKIYKAG